VIATFWGLTTSTVLVVTLVALVGSFFQATAGFGFALLAVPLMSLVVSPETAVVVVFLQATGSSLITAHRHRAHVDWSEARRLSIGAVVAMPIGVVVLLTASASVLRFLLGVVTCSAALWMLAPSTKRRPPLEVRPVVTYGFGAVSGVLNTALSTNGPPLVVYLRARGHDVVTFRSTISVVFTISNVVGLALLLASGAVHEAAYKYFVLTLAFVLVGWVAGNATASKLAGVQFARLVDLLLLVSGALAIAKAFVG
jgi:uncharacterized membrane protein YfcA